jgi:hypothetical protein
VVVFMLKSLLLSRLLRCRCLTGPPQPIALEHEIRQPDAPVDQARKKKCLASPAPNLEK